MYYSPFVAITYLIFVFFFMCIVLRPLYDSWCLSRSRSHHIRRIHRPTMVFVPTNPAHSASRGLDLAVAKSLPVFTFSDVTHTDSIDCAVCLSEFEEGESCRVLPSCKHAFHVECIDMWFHSHSTCPLCRSLVEPPATTVEEQVAIVTIPPEPGSISDQRSAPSSFVGVPSQSMPSSCEIVMIESNIEREGEEIK